MKVAIVALLFGLVVLATTSDAGRHDCICSRELAPVCGSDGVTYSNKCQFKCVKGELKGRAADDLKIARGGDCNGPEIPEFTEEF